MSAFPWDAADVDLHLREATPADAEGVARVYVESWNDGFTDLMPPRVLDARQIARWSRDLDAELVRWRLVESGESVVGFVGTGPSRYPIDPDLGELDTIAVAPHAWRRGVGRRLMDATLDDLRGGDYGQAILWTPATTNEGAPSTRPPVGTPPVRSATLGGRSPSVMFSSVDRSSARL